MVSWKINAKKNITQLLTNQNCFNVVILPKILAIVMVIQWDVVLIDLNTNKKLDMGARFDFMDTLSHLDVEPPLITTAAHQNRKNLTEAMQLFGFEADHKEFWHFTYHGQAGREVDIPLDIDITPELRGIGCQNS